MTIWYYLRVPAEERDDFVWTMVIAFDLIFLLMFGFGVWGLTITL